MPELVTADAGLLLGISRQTVSQQELGLIASGQVRRMGSRLVIEADRLFNWWISNCRAGETWQRLAKLRQLLAPDLPERRMLYAGGIEALEQQIGVIALFAPDAQIEVEILAVMLVDGQRAPVTDLAIDWLNRVERHRSSAEGKLEIVPNSGAALRAGQWVQVWELP